MPGNVIYRSTAVTPPSIQCATSFTVTTSENKRLVDMSGGACCAILGHTNAAVTNAIIRQLRTVPNIFSGFWSADITEQAGDLIAGIFAQEYRDPDWFGGIIFQQGGGEAVDFACKLAAQYHMEAKQHRPWIAVRDFGYHGIGTFTAALSDNYPRYGIMDHYRRIAQKNIVRFPHPLSYRSGTVVMPAALLKAMIDTNHILGKYANELSAVLIEPVNGPPVGAWANPKEYLQDLRNFCDASGALLIFDEVLCGSYRCGALSVGGLYGVKPDIVVLGKGIAAGYQPVSAIVISKKVRERINAGSKQIMFGTAYSAHTAGVAAVHATLSAIKNLTDDLVRLTFDLGRSISNAIGHASIPIVYTVRGKGALIGIELRGRDGATFKPQLDAHLVVRKAIAQAGAVVYSKGQTMHGAGDFITIAPPINITKLALRSGIQAIIDGLNEASKILPQ